MIEDCAGMQNGVQVIDILVEMSVQIRHVRPPNSFRFEGKNPLRKTAAIFKAGLNNFFASGLAYAQRSLPAVIRQLFRG
jgi:hypothetical protein